MSLSAFLFHTNIIKADFLDNNDLAYWDGCKFDFPSWSCTSSPSGLLSPYSNNGASYCESASGTNCAYVYDSNAVNIYPVVNSYASKIGTATGAIITGRLMLLEEAYALKNANTNGADAVKDMNGRCYCLGLRVISPSCGV